MSVGYTFSVLIDERATDKITRNVGFYPSIGASPVSRVDQGRSINGHALAAMDFRNIMQLLEMLLYYYLTSNSR